MRAAGWVALALLGPAVAGLGALTRWRVRAAPPPVEQGSPSKSARTDPPQPTQPVRRVASEGNSLQDRATELTLRLVARLDSDHEASDPDDSSRLRAELLGMGELAAAPLVAQLGRETDPARRDALLDLLRSVPGGAAEDCLIEEARSDQAASNRSIAMDALAERRSERSLEALHEIARTDPYVPNRPFIADPRRPEDTSSELPDEVDFTPRMKAMVALASTHDLRVVPMLLGVLVEATDESLRMEAARNLKDFRAQPEVLDGLGRAAAGDPSAYVRLAALHSLDGASHSQLSGVVSEIATRDRDAGVRGLAARVLARLESPH